MNYRFLSFKSPSTHYYGVLLVCIGAFLLHGCGVHIVDGVTIIFILQLVIPHHALLDRCHHTLKSSWYGVLLTVSLDLNKSIIFFWFRISLWAIGGSNLFEGMWNHFLQVDLRIFGPRVPMNIVYGVGVVTVEEGENKYSC